MFNIKNVEVLTSQVGRGLKIGNTTLGCAKITEIELPEGATLKQIAEADGITLGYKVSDNRNTDAPNEHAKIEFNTTDLTTAVNYVLVTIDDEEKETNVVTSCKQITELFDLPDEDAEALTTYIGELATSRNLNMVQTEDLDGNPFFFFVNTFDQDMLELYLDDDQDGLFNNFVGLTQSPEYHSELMNHNFIKMFLVGLIKANQDRYNTTHRDKVLCDIAKQLRSIRYWEDGRLLAPSIKDIEDFITEIKNQIVIE